MVSADQDADTETMVVGDSGEPAEERVIYPIFQRPDQGVVEFAADIARGADRELVLLDLVAGEQEYVNEARHVTGQRFKSELEFDLQGQVRARIEETTDPVGTTVRLGRQLDAALMVFDRHTPTSFVDRIRGTVPERVGAQVPCDTVSVAGARGRHGVSSVLVPISEGGDTAVAVTVAGALARGANAIVELFYISDEKTTEEEGRASVLFETHESALPAAIESNRWHVAASRPADAIVEQSDHYDITIMGAPNRSRLRRFLGASTVVNTVRERARNRVLVARKHGGTFKNE